MIGQTLAHYRVTAALGAGGMGEVYCATDTKLNREVAIKVLPPEVAQDPERLARFQREAQLLAALNHPNIAAIHGLEEADGKPFLALELVEGAVELRARGDALELGTPTPLFEVGTVGTDDALNDFFAPAPDGQRFLVAVAERAGSPWRLQLTLDWPAVVE